MVLGGLGAKLTQKQVEKMMKKMNIQEQTIPAEEVIIKTRDKKIVIENPDVRLINMMGNNVYQVAGEVREESNLKEEDVSLVMEKTGRPRDEVVSKLQELNNDLAKAIMELQKKEKE